MKGGGGGGEQEGRAAVSERSTSTRRRWLWRDWQCKSTMPEASAASSARSPCLVRNGFARSPTSDVASRQVACRILSSSSSLLLLLLLLCFFWCLCVFSTLFICQLLVCLLAVAIEFYYRKHRVEICVRLLRICNRLSTRGKPT